MARPLAILGAGPIGLFAAIRARQLGSEVDVYCAATPRLPERVDCLPAQFLALLVEFGVSPDRVGIDRLHEARTLQWGSPAPGTRPAPPSVHVSRPALEHALQEAAQRAGASLHEIGERTISDLIAQHAAGSRRVLDATGRAAVTADERVSPHLPIVARFFHAAPAREPNSGLSLAATPEGYIYRLGNTRHLTVGVVGRGRFVRGSPDEVLRRIGETVPWIVEDLRRMEFRCGGSSAASIQLALRRSGRCEAVGDAAFARDSLSSQGLSAGLGDAFRRLSDGGAGGGAGARQIVRHAYEVVKRIAASPFAADPAWRAYTGFLAGLPGLVADPDPVPELLR